MSDDREPRWHWRNCRDATLTVQLSPLRWRWGLGSESDVYCWGATLCLGPITLMLNADHGSCSSDNWLEARLGLSETEAWDRALRFEGKK